MEIQTRSVVGVFETQRAAEQAKLKVAGESILLLRTELVQSPIVGAHVLGLMMPQLEADYLYRQLQKGRTLLIIQVPAEDGHAAFKFMSDSAGSQETTALWGRSEKVLRIVTSPV